MRRVAIRELKEHTSEILRQVREEAEAVEVTYHGRAVARIVPVVEPRGAESVEEFLERWDELSQEISALWPTGVSAVDAVREDRREL